MFVMISVFISIVIGIIIVIIIRLLPEEARCSGGILHTAPRRQAGPYTIRYCYCYYYYYYYYY